MKNNKFIVKTFVMNICLFMTMVALISAKPSNDLTSNTHPKLGTWQGIIDGKEGE